MRVWHFPEFILVLRLVISSQIPHAPICKMEVDLFVFMAPISVKPWLPDASAETPHVLFNTLAYVAL